jgi:hypothetical protein
VINRWNREPYVIDSQPDITIPVYVIRPEYVKGKLKPKTVHRNLLLPIYSLPTEELVHQIRKTVNPIQCKISDITHNKEPIAKTVTTEADHVSRNQLSDESDSDDDIVTHVVPTRHKISVQKPLNPLAEVFSPIGSTTSESILEMSNHSRSLEVSNDTDDIVSGHATDASRSSSRNDDSLGIHQHNEVTNENEVSGEVDSLIDGIQSPIEQTRETVVRRTGRHTKKPDRYGDYIYF